MCFKSEIYFPSPAGIIENKNRQYQVMAILLTSLFWKFNWAPSISSMYICHFDSHPYFYLSFILQCCHSYSSYYWYLLLYELEVLCVRVMFFLFFFLILVYTFNQVCSDCLIVWWACGWCCRYKERPFCRSNSHLECALNMGCGCTDTVDACVTFTTQFVWC